MYDQALAFIHLGAKKTIDFKTIDFSPVLY